MLYPAVEQCVGVAKVRLASVWIAAVIAVVMAGLAGSARADAIEDCLKSDTYHEMNETYVLCSSALQQSDVPAETRTKLLIARGEAAYFAGQIQTASSDLDAALKLDPDNDKAHYRRAWIRIHLDQYQGAIDDVSGLLAKNADDADALFTIAYIFHDTDQWETKTLPAYRRALEINPKLHLARKNLATLLGYTMGRPDLAIQEYDRILSAGPKELREVRLWRWPGRASYDFHGLIRADRAELQMKIEGAAGVIEELDDLVREYPDVPWTYVLGGRYYKDKADWDMLRKNAETAMELSPIDLGQHGQLLEALYYLKRNQEGLDAADKMLGLPIFPEPDNAMKYYLRGFFHKKLGHKDEAIRDLETAFMLDPAALNAGLTQLMQSGYYTGKVDDPYSPAIRNALEACIIDPACPRQ
jgi:tetratricopeptide (TPR) repeat protein